MEAERLYNLADYRNAANILGPLATLDDLARPLLLDCLLKLKDRPGLLACFDPPASAAEAIHVMDALWAEGRRDRLDEVLKLPLIAESADQSVIEMRKKYAARLNK
jgi:hypothetical protein